MNRPGSSGGNWTWRFQESDLHMGTAAYLRELSQLFGRSPYPVGRVGDLDGE